MGICGKLLQIIVPGVVIIFAMVAAATATASTMPSLAAPTSVEMLKFHSHLA
jgi:galactitol-specific phosphotransferase system IIC component